MKTKKTSMGKWLDDLNEACGLKFVRLETHEGVNRSGKLSGLRTKRIKFNGEFQDVITELELNSDPTDTVTITSLVSIAID